MVSIKHRRRYLITILVSVLSLASCLDGCAPKIVETTRGDSSKADNDKGYLLKEFLGGIPEVFLPSVLEAISQVAPEEKMDAMRFTPLLGGLHNSRLLHNDHLKEENRWK